MQPHLGSEHWPLRFTSGVSHGCPSIKAGPGALGENLVTKRTVICTAEDVMLNGFGTVVASPSVG